MAYKKPRLQDRQSVVEDVRSAQTFTRLGLLIQKQEDTNESVKSVADGISDIKDALVDSAESNEDTNKGIGALTNVFSEQLDFMKQEKLNNAGDILEDQNEDDGDDTPELKGFAKFLKEEGYDIGDYIGSDEWVYNIKLIEDKWKPLIKCIVF